MQCSIQVLRIITLVQAAGRRPYIPCEMLISFTPSLIFFTQPLHWQCMSSFRT
jgi:hypothetical protein